MDDFVSAVVDAVTDQYSDTQQIADALNVYVNRTGWAYLVYKVAYQLPYPRSHFQMGPPPSLSSTSNVKHDPNYCEKFVVKTTGGEFLEWQIFAGMINDN
jgi:hypothetical protein